MTRKYKDMGELDAEFAMRYFKARSLSPHQSAQHINDILNIVDEGGDFEGEESYYRAKDEMESVDLSYIGGIADGNVERAYKALLDREWDEVYKYLMDALEEYVLFHRNLRNDIIRDVERAFSDAKTVSDLIHKGDYQGALEICKAQKNASIEGRYFVLKKLYTNRALPQNEAHHARSFFWYAFPGNALEVIVRSGPTEKSVQVVRNRVNAAPDHYMELMKQIRKSIAPKGAHRF